MSPFLSFVAAAARVPASAVRLRLDSTATFRRWLGPGEATRRTLGRAPAAARVPPVPRLALLQPQAFPPRAAASRSGCDQSSFADGSGRKVLLVTGPYSREPAVAAPLRPLIPRGERRVLENTSLSFLKSQAHGGKLQGDRRFRCGVRLWNSLRSPQNRRTSPFSAAPGGPGSETPRPLASARGALRPRPAVTTQGPAPSSVRHRHRDCVTTPTRRLPRPRLSLGPRAQAVPGRQSRWAGPFVLLAREAVTGSSQPASVTQNMVAPLCAFNCRRVHGPRELAVDIENKRTEPFARPDRCPVAPPHSARHLLLKEGSF